MNDEVRPEELWQSLNRNSREVFSKREIISFLEEWSDSESFVEDLDFVVDDDRGSIRPEEVFEHLAKSNNHYTINEMLKMSEEASNRQWERSPEISDTGNSRKLELRDKCVVPGEEEFLDIGENFYGRTKLQSKEKDLWMVQHKDYYEFEVSPVSTEEFLDIFVNAESLMPSQCLHEVEYGDEVYYLDSEDLNYFFEFEEEFDEFNDDVHRIESSYNAFVIESSKIPDKSDYDVYIFSWRKSVDAIEAAQPVIGPELSASLETKLMMQYVDEVSNNSDN